MHKQAQKYLATTTPKKSMPSHSPSSPGQCCSNQAWCCIDTIMVGKNKATPFSDHRTREVGTVGSRVWSVERRPGKTKLHEKLQLDELTSWLLAVAAVVKLLSSASRLGSHGLLKHRCTEACTWLKFYNSPIKLFIGYTLQFRFSSSSLVNALGIVNS